MKKTVLDRSFVAFVFLFFTFTFTLLNIDGLVVGVGGGFCLVLSVTAGHMFFVQTSKCVLGLLLSGGVKWTER